MEHQLGPADGAGPESERAACSAANIKPLAVGHDLLQDLVCLEKAVQGSQAAQVAGLSVVRGALVRLKGQAAYSYQQVRGAEEQPDGSWMLRVGTDAQTYQVPASWASSEAINTKPGFAEAELEELRTRWPSMLSSRLQVARAQWRVQGGAQMAAKIEERQGRLSGGGLPVNDSALSALLATLRSTKGVAARLGRVEADSGGSRARPGLNLKAGPLPPAWQRGQGQLEPLGSTPGQAGCSRYAVAETAWDPSASLAAASHAPQLQPAGRPAAWASEQCAALATAAPSFREAAAASPTPAQLLRPPPPSAGRTTGAWQPEAAGMDGSWAEAEQQQLNHRHRHHHQHPMHQQQQQQQPSFSQLPADSTAGAAALLAPALAPAPTNPPASASAPELTWDLIDRLVAQLGPRPAPVSRDPQAEDMLEPYYAARLPCMPATEGASGEEWPPIDPAGDPGWARSVVWDEPAAAAAAAAAAAGPCHTPYTPASRPAAEARYQRPSPDMGGRPPRGDSPSRLRRQSSDNPSWSGREVSPWGRYGQSLSPSRRSRHVRRSMPPFRSGRAMSPRSERSRGRSRERSRGRAQGRRRADRSPSPGGRHRRLPSTSPLPPVQQRLASDDLSPPPRPLVPPPALAPVHLSVNPGMRRHGLPTVSRQPVQETRSKPKYGDFWDPVWRYENSLVRTLCQRGPQEPRRLLERCPLPPILKQRGPEGGGDMEAWEWDCFRAFLAQRPKLFLLHSGADGLRAAAAPAAPALLQYKRDLLAHLAKAQRHGCRVSIDGSLLKEVELPADTPTELINEAQLDIWRFITGHFKNDVWCNPPKVYTPPLYPLRTVELRPFRDPAPLPSAPRMLGVCQDFDPRRPGSCIRQELCRFSHCQERIFF